MYSFFVQAHATYKALFHWLNRLGYISGVIVQPFANVLMYAILGRFGGSADVARDFALGINVYAMSFVLFNGLAQTYYYDRTGGTLQYFFLSTCNRFQNFTARALLHFPNAMISFFMGMLAARFVAGLDFSYVNWPVFICAVLVTSFSLIAVGQLLGVISIVLRNWIGTQGIAYGLVLLLCGAIIPIKTFPAPVQVISHLIPIANGLPSVKGAFVGMGFKDVGFGILIELILGLAYFFTAYICFLLFEGYVKKTGKLERDMQ